MASTLNTHQFCLLKSNPHRQINHPFKFSFNLNISQIKPNHSNPSMLLKPSLAHPLQIAPQTPPRRTDVVVCSFQVWGPPSWGPTTHHSRADFRVWAKGGSGSKGKKKRARITVECTECTKNRYTTEKNSLNSPGKMELRKYCPNCRLHTTHKEIK